MFANYLLIGTQRFQMTLIDFVSDSTWSFFHVSNTTYKVFSGWKSVKKKSAKSD